MKTRSLFCHTIAVALICLGLAGTARRSAAVEPLPIFTHPPTDLTNVGAVVPLRNLAPAGGHVLAVDHMYLDYPDPANGGSDTYPVYAMGNGSLVMVLRQQIEDRPDLDYQIFIKHDKYVTSQFTHLHGLSDRITSHLSTNGPPPWISTPDPNMQLMLLGQLGAPPPLPLTAGEQVGITKSYSSNWDVGVIDKRVRPRFAKKGLRRYPTFWQIARSFGLTLKPAFGGHKSLNAACFIDYMPSPMREQWHDLLASEPKSCGSNAWDLKGTLRGAWFNPLVDTANPPPLFSLENAALSVIPYNYAPTNQVQIGIGSGTEFSALDPDGVYPQLDHPLVLTFNPTPGARINPDPSQVTPLTGTVCYDLAYNGGGGTQYNYILFRLVSSKRLAIKFDPTPSCCPICDEQLLTEPDETWTTTYVR